MKKLLLALSLTLILTACSETAPVETDPTDETPTKAVDIEIDSSDWVALQGQGFYVLAPAGWTLTSEQGVESYAGTISGDGMSLSFDYGAFVDDEFKDQNADYASSKENIDGKDSIIYLPRNTIEGKLGIFMNVSENEKLSMTGEALDLNERLTLLKVLRSVELD
ncbi:lipoprotein [Candidatus Peregrinibacteria bacterium]|nr:MAG: lipoprotein [Candidatus Peregrinibacteria bacterium]